MRHLPRRRVASGIGAFLALVALVVGVPWLLWAAVGWPLPATWPTLDQVGDGLIRTQVSDEAVLKVIAVIGWLAWLQVLASFALEAASALRHRPAASVRLPGPIQPAVRKLIATIVIVIGSASVSAPPLGLAPRPAAAAPAGPPPPPVMHAETHPAAVTPPQVGPTYTVVPRDTLWGIAERHLGDPLRWREVYALNEGRSQPVGGSLVDKDLIQPGWVLLMPVDAIDVAPTVTADDTVAPPAPPSDPVPPPETLAPPPTAAPAVASAAPLEPSSSVTVTTSAPTTPSDAASEASPDESTVQPIVTSALGAAALVGVLSVLRLVRRRRRIPGRLLPAPSAEHEHTERRLRAVADLDAANLLDIALRAFARGCTTRKAMPPKVLAVRATDTEVEILLERAPDRPPLGFVSAGHQRSWKTSPQTDLAPLADYASDCGAPLPSLVSLGTLDGAELLIDIESAGLLTIDGDTDIAENVIRSVATQLATSCWIDYVDIITVGDDAADLPGTDRVHHVPTIAEALDLLESERGSIATCLGICGVTTTQEARLGGHPGDGWAPRVLVTAAAISTEELDRLVSVVGDGGQGVGAVVMAPSVGEWHAHASDGRLSVTPLGFSLDPATISGDSLREIDDLFTDLAIADPNESEQELVEQTPSEAPAARVHVAGEPPAVEVQVSVLGELEIFGIEEPMERRKCVELAAYLALHPEGATDQRIKTALWPARCPKDSTFNSTVSLTRSALGASADDARRLPLYADSGKRYRLAPTVSTDVALLEQDLALASQLPAGEAIALLQSRLESVRGTPFGAKGFGWAFSEGHVARAEALVSDAAHRLAQLSLDSGDADTAGWAARQGLVAVPGEEALYRDRMLACHLAGNTTGIEAVMRELCEVIEVLEPYDEVHPDTMDLYLRLTNRRRSSRV